MKLPNVRDLGFDLTAADLETTFEVHSDEFGHYVPNINQTLYIDPGLSLSAYVPDHPLHWTTLSYRLYGTTRLAWLLLKLNNVKADRVFDRVIPGRPIFCVDRDVAGQIVTMMGEIE